MTLHHRYLTTCLLAVFLSACSVSSEEEADPTNPAVTGHPSGSFEEEGSPADKPSYLQGSISTHQASRFLSQATFGPTPEDIARLKQFGYSKWIDKQISLPPSYLGGRVEELKTKMCLYERGPDDTEEEEPSITNTPRLVIKYDWDKYARHQAWWETALKSEDQLRHRVAFALSQIVVVSDQSGGGLESRQTGLASYYDMLARHAFGNYGELLFDVARHPAMGVYLTHANNKKADPENNTRPDENFARELLQLFSIGVNKLNLDGTSVVDGDGETIPSYGQETIEEFAKVFTGWTFDRQKNGRRVWDSWYGVKGTDVRQPMVAWETHHDTSEKRLLNGVVLPAGQSAEQDLRGAIANIMEHSNVGPFVSNLLIKRLVKSNPSPAYIRRVAEVFNDNGQGEKGDLGAVVKAILLDREARVPGDAAGYPDGKLKSPVIRIANLWRAFPLSGGTYEGFIRAKSGYLHRCNQGTYQYYLWAHQKDFLYLHKKYSGMSVMGSPSVFNFYAPDFSPQGEMRQEGLAGPEFELMTEDKMVSTLNFLNKGIYSEVTIPPFERENPDALSYMDISAAVRLADDTDSVLDYLSLVLLNDNMSDSLRDVLTDYLSASGSDIGPLGKVRDLISLIITSPDFLVQE